MPLFYSAYTTDRTRCSVWKCIEDDSFYAGRLALFAEEQEELATLKTKRKSEWLASRYLLACMTRDLPPKPCIKDEHGKPHLSGSGIMVSLSHTEGFVAAIRSTKPCGVDIQVLTPKIQKIASRFISADEQDAIRGEDPLPDMHTIWSAKEAIYKAYGRKQLDFKGHIFIKPFIFNKSGFEFSGYIKKEDYYAKFTLFCRRIENTILVYAIEN